MLLPGTEIHIVTFIIVLFELIIFFFQVIYYLSRPSDKRRLWFLILIGLLIYYNCVSGFLPDENIPVSLTVQNIVAFSGGLLMSMYFAFYFYKAFDLAKLKFYAYWGALLFLFIPFALFFLIPYLLTGDLNLSRQMVVVVPFFYAVTFLIALTKAIKAKYKDDKGENFKEEIAGMYLGVLFWISLPVVVYFDGSQLLENSFANVGLLVMTIMFIRSAIGESRNEYNKLLASERKLQEMNVELAKKVKERTRQLELANEQRLNTFINLAHETKTPLTLINNYLEDHVRKVGETEELKAIRYGIEKLSNDIVNLFDVERFNKGLHVYNHDQITDFSTIIKESILLFKKYCQNNQIELIEDVEDSVPVKADPEAIYRVVYNLIENSIKYSVTDNNKIKIRLKCEEKKVVFRVSDTGIGIPVTLQKRIFDPYFQIHNQKKNFQGMGLGLSIIKNITDSLGGTISVKSDPDTNPGTEITIILKAYNQKAEVIPEFSSGKKKLEFTIEKLEVTDEVDGEDKPFILLIEDNVGMLNYLVKKLREKYNLYIATDGGQAIKKLKNIKKLDLIISDIMMDKVDGFDFYKSISQESRFGHVPLIFLTAKTTMKDRKKGMEMGAIDYISKPFNSSDLITKIDSVLNNIRKQKMMLLKSLVDGAEALQQVPVEGNNHKTGFINNCDLYNLTSREADIVKLLAKGYTHKAIGDSLHISGHTVSKHVQNIFEKVGVNNRLELLNKLEVNSSAKA